MFTADLLERAVKTFIQAALVTFTGLMTVPGDVTDVGAWKAAGLAALAGALSAGVSAVMSLLSKPVGDKDSASLLKPVTPQDHPVV